MFEEKQNVDHNQTLQMESDSKKQKYKGVANGWRCDTKPSEIQRLNTKAERKNTAAVYQANMKGLKC